MGLTLKELLAMKVDLFTLEEINGIDQIIIRCVNCSSDDIEIAYSYGELVVSACNEDIRDSKSLFLGYEVDIKDINIEKSPKQIMLTFPNEE